MIKLLCLMLALSQINYAGIESSGPDWERSRNDRDQKGERYEYGPGTDDRREKFDPNSTTLESNIDRSRDS